MALRSALAATLVCFFAGCPEAQVVTVTMKTVEGAPGAAAGEATPPVVEAKGYGFLSGTITFEGSVPSYPPLVALGGAGLKPEDKAVCAAQPVPDETLVVNSANKGLANAVVFLDKRPANIKPDLAKPPTDPIYFDQKGCRFFPHVLVLQAGQPLLVVSEDSIPHNTHTRPKRNPDFNQLIKANDRTGVPCNYKKAESAPIEVVCDLHTWMKAYHFPLDHPYAAATDKDGKFKIEGLPAGKHNLNIWHERGPGDSRLLARKLEITIDVDKETTKDLNFGADKFAGVPRSPRRAIAYGRLLDGGELEVTQSEGRR
jgi:hypothetical protein